MAGVGWLSCTAAESLRATFSGHNFLMQSKSFYHKELRKSAAMKVHFHESPRRDSGTLVSFFDPKMWMFEINFSALNTFTLYDLGSEYVMIHLGLNNRVR